MIQHARTYLFSDLDQLTPQGLDVRTLYFFTGFGHAAVMVFFVLSGFLVGGSALAAIEEGRFSWRRYLLQRGTRLWVVLIPALVLTAMWDHAAVLVTAHPQTLAAHARTNAFPGHPWTVEGHGIVAFVGNALFMMNFLVPTFGSNGSLWSLGSEFSYYVLFPLAAIAVLGLVGRAGSRDDIHHDVRRALVTAALFGIVAWAIEPKILEWGPIWLMGVAAARAPRIPLSRRASATLAMALGAVLVGVLAWHRATTNDITFARDATVGALCALVIYALRCGPEDAGAAVRAPARITRAFLALAGFGYTLYLVHEPPLAFLRECIIARPHQRWTPSPVHITIGVAIVAAIVAYAYAISRVTEARTDDVRAWLQRRLAAWHPSFAAGTHRLADATARTAPAPTWHPTAES